MLDCEKASSPWLGEEKKAPTLDLPPVTSDPQVESFFAELAGQIPLNRWHDFEKRTLQSKLRENFLYLVQNYLVES